MPPASSSLSAASSGSHHASAKSWASSTTIGVEPVAGLELCCQVGHLERKVVLPELDGLLGAHRFVGAFGCAPQHAEGVELADVGRAVGAAATSR